MLAQLSPHTNLRSTKLNFEMEWYVICNCIKEAGSRGLDIIAWQAILDDFDALASGIFTDDDGVVWSLILIFGTGDMEQLCIQWGLRSYNDPQEMCGLCRANRGTRPFTDMQAGAVWRPTADMSCEVTLNNRKLF